MLKRFTNNCITKKQMFNFAYSSRRDITFPSFMKRSKSKYALLSCSNKNKLDQLAKKLINKNYKILATSSTYDYLIENDCDESKIFNTETKTYFPEILGGRVKTLDGTILGGLLADREDDLHKQDMIDYNLPDIRVVVCNLYPFEHKVHTNTRLNEAIEYIDVGGVTLIRSAAKNFKYTSVIVDPHDYDLIQLDKELNLETRKELATKAFQLTSTYDEEIFEYLSYAKTNPKNKLYGCNDKNFNSIYKNKKEQTLTEQTLTEQTLTEQTLTEQTLTEITDYVYPIASKSYYPKHLSKVIDLKYGCNPHQKTSFICVDDKQKLPFDIFNGTPSYINILDAMRGWELVKDLNTITGQVAAASLKHTSPAGVAIPYTGHTNYWTEVCHTQTPESPEANAYIKARNSDPLSSFGDFVAISGKVNLELAKYLKREVSDGIIASDFDQDALELLK